MSLDGLRAWIGEVERKLDTRTRIFLVLAVIAVGGAAAGIYLGIDARNNEVSKSDLQATQRQIEERLGGGSNVTQLEADLKALEAEVEELKGGGAAGQAEGGAGAGGKTGKSGGAGTGGSGTTGKQGTEGASNGSVPPQELEEAIKKAQQKSEEAEAGK
jgi:hypothetical protein